MLEKQAVPVSRTKIRFDPACLEVDSITLWHAPDDSKRLKGYCPVLTITGFRLG
jgi:hypothetical protein